MLARFRLAYQQVMMPVAKLLLRIGLTANAVTTLGLLLALITSYYLLVFSYWPVVIFLFLTIVVDGLDGLVARISGPTKFGDFYDAFIDRVVEVILYVSIALSFPGMAFLSFLTLVLSLITSYVPARAEVWTIGEKIRYISVGSRAERMVVLFLGFLFMQIQPSLYMISLLCVFGIVHRFFSVYRQLS